jgi:myo-inositol-1(or 4)-monophosphatase
MHPMLNIAVRAARQAGTVIAKGFENREKLNPEIKGENDYVTQIDKDAELSIINKIRQSYPSHSFLGEEGGAIEGEDDTFKWIIDPLDGTTNFIKGIPHFSVSIALMYKGRLDQAVVFDPIRGELFTASRGNGAQLNGYRIRINPVKTLANTILGTAFPFKQRERLANFTTQFSEILQQAGDIRRSGSAALDLAYVASGRFDGYFEAGLKPWDMAAGELIVKEAGGIITDFQGGMDQMQSGDIVAGSPRVVQELVKHLKGKV